MGIAALNALRSSCEIANWTGMGKRKPRFGAYSRTCRGEGDRHILLTGHRKMSQSPPVFGQAVSRASGAIA